MNRFFTKFLLLLAVVVAGLSADSHGQSSLSTGDILFTSFDSRGPAVGVDNFSFVLLTSISNGTQIRFTDRGYGGSSWNPENGSSETAILWTSNSALPIGTEIKISALTATVVSTGNTIGSVVPINSSTGLSLSGLDQIIAYQGFGDVSTATTLLAGIHWNNCSGNTTNDASWDNAGICGSVTGTSGSTMPPGLSASFSAMWAGTTGGMTNIAGRFECTGTPSTSISTIRTNVLNRSVNWTYITSTAQSITVPAGCTYYGVAAPTITTNPSNSAICAGSNATFSVAANGATTYQWQVSTTGTAGTYTNLSNTGPYSGITGTMLTIAGATAGMNGYAYRAAAINVGGTTYSSGAVLTVDNGFPAIGAQPSDVAICPGGTTILSGSATGGTITYRWQVNTGSGFTNITDGGVYSNSGTSSLTITGATTSMYGYQYRLTATNFCGTSNSSAATLTFRTNWTGGNGTDWNSASNWFCNVVPDVNTDVVIPNITNQPVVSTVASMARNVTINPGAGITVAASSTLTVSGDISNLGTITATASGATLSFNSASAQFIPGGTYANIAVAGGGNKTLAGNVTINTNISFSSGKIYLGANTLTMASTAGTPNASAANYVVTNGAGGYKRMGLGSSGIVFIIGTATNYTPFLLSNTGTADNFTGRVMDGVYTSYTNDVPNGSPISSNVVNKTWFITEDVAGGSNANLTVQWNLADELSPFNRTACFLAHYVGSAWQNNSSPSASSPSTGSGPYTKSLSGITSFSPFGVGGIGSPLPVKLVSFSGRADKNGNNLAWTTASEQSMEGYHIERSDDGRNFSEIGYVQALGGASGYGFLDQTASGAARRYYRLNMAELNGAHEYSQIISIAGGNTAHNLWTASPNPVTGDDLYLQPSINSADVVEISITDVSGRMWYRGAGNTAKATTLNLQAVPAGIYVLQLKSGTSVQTIKLVRK